MNKDQFSTIMHYAEFIAAGMLLAGLFEAGRIGDVVVALLVGLALLFVYLERKFRLELTRTKTESAD